MANKSYKIQIDGQLFKNKIKSKGYTIKRLGSEISRGEKTILRAIHDNEISPPLLEEIANHLNTSVNELISDDCQSSLTKAINNLMRSSMVIADFPPGKIDELDEESRRLFEGEMIGSVYSIVKKYF